MKFSDEIKTHVSKVLNMYQYKDDATIADAVLPSIISLLYSDDLTG